jgi:hypothetical protein
MQGNASRDGLLLQEVGDELIIYDRENHRAHHLNRAAAFVWRNWDGEATVGKMAERLQAELQAPVEEDVIRDILARLREAKLVPAATAAVQPGEVLSRRALLERTGMAAALIPIITSIAVPTPAAASSSQAQASGSNSTSNKPPGNTGNKPKGNQPKGNQPKGNQPRKG